MLKRALWSLVLALGFAPLGACGGSGGGGGGGSTAVEHLFTVLVSTSDLLDPTISSEVEIVNLATATRTGGFVLPGVGAMSIAVAPDGSRIYLADRKNGAVLVRSRAGADLGTIPFTGVTDLVIDATGANLWVGSIQPAKVQRFDALTLAAGPSVTTIGCAGGMALSPDGSTLAWTSHAGFGQATSGAYVANAQTLAGPLLATFTTSSCNTLANEVSFVSNTRLVVWDANCDRLHQVDVATGTYIGNASDISFGQDGGASSNLNNVLVSHPTLLRTWGFKESGVVWRADPFGVTGGALVGLTGTPFLLALGAAQTDVYVHSSGAPVTLDRIAAAAGTVTPDVYTFTSTLPIPRDAVSCFLVP